MSNELELSPETWGVLHELNRREIEFDGRESVDTHQMNLCQRLENVGYATSHETGPGGNVLVFSISPAGKNAFKAHFGN